MNYSNLLDKFYESEVKYLLCGGLAVNLHGVPRMTADIDILLDFGKSNLERFQKCVGDLKYNLSIPIQITQLADQEIRDSLIKNKNLLALSYFNYDNHYLNLDVVLNVPLAFEEMWSRKVVMNNNGSEYYVVCIDDLIKLKEYANRIQDQQDIYFLSKLKPDGRQG